MRIAEAAVAVAIGVSAGVLQVAAKDGEAVEAVVGAEVAADVDKEGAAAGVAALSGLTEEIGVLIAGGLTTGSRV